MDGEESIIAIVFARHAQTKLHLRKCLLKLSRLRCQLGGQCLIFTLICAEQFTQFECVGDTPI